MLNVDLRIIVQGKLEKHLLLSCSIFSILVSTLFQVCRSLSNHGTKKTNKQTLVFLVCTLPPSTVLAMPLVQFTHLKTHVLFMSCMLVSFNFGWFPFISATPEGQQELPENRSMRVENKNFYFDIGNNYRGIFMRLSEVQVS